MDDALRLAIEPLQSPTFVSVAGDGLRAMHERRRRDFAGRGFSLTAGHGIERLAYGLASTGVLVLRLPRCCRIRAGGRPGRLSRALASWLAATQVLPKPHRRPSRTSPILPAARAHAWAEWDDPTLSSLRLDLVVASDGRRPFVRVKSFTLTRSRRDVPMPRSQSVGRHGSKRGNPIEVAMACILPCQAPAI